MRCIACGKENGRQDRTPCSKDCEDLAACVEWLYENAEGEEARQFSGRMTV